MRLDEVKGGIKVFTEEESREGDEDEGGVRVYNLRLRRDQSEGGGSGGDRRKRKNWGPPEGGNVGAGEKSASSARLRKTQSLLPNSPKIDGEKGVEGSLSNAAEGEEIEIDMEERRRSFDDKEMVVAGKKSDQICDKSVSSIAGEKMSDAAERKQAVDLDVERSSPEAAACLDVIPAPASPLPMAIKPPPERTPPKVIEMRAPGKAQFSTSLRLARGISIPDSDYHRILRLVSLALIVMDEGFDETMTEAEHRMQSIGVFSSFSSTEFG